MSRLEKVRRLGVDSWLRQRGVPPIVAIWMPVLAGVLIVEAMHRMYALPNASTVQLVIGATALILYAGRRRSLRWSRRDEVRDLVWTADVLGVAIPSYGYWRHAGNHWRRGQRLTAAGYALTVAVLATATLIFTCGVAALPMLYFNGASRAIARLRHEVDVALLGDGEGNAGVLAHDLDDITTQRRQAEKALETARHDVRRVERELQQMRESVAEAEEHMRHVRELQELDPADQAVIVEIRDTARGIVATMTSIDQRAAGESEMLDRKSMLLWWVALILSIPANILATIMTVRLGIGTP